MRSLADVIDLALAYMLATLIACLPPRPERARPLYPFSIVAVISCALLQLELDRFDVARGLAIGLALLGALCVAGDRDSGWRAAAACLFFGMIGAAIGSRQRVLALLAAAVCYAGLRLRWRELRLPTSRSK